MKSDHDVIIDSDMSFAQAISGTTAPDELIDTLSMVDVIYYSFDGLRHQGQIVVDARLEDEIHDLFATMEKLKFPIGRVIPVVAYGWNDMASMTDNNTSSFNFRMIADTDKLSLHAFGRALDINPMQNPVIYPASGVAPQGAVYTPGKPGVFLSGHPVVEAFIERGWHWGGLFDQPKDYHHFEKI